MLDEISGLRDARATLTTPEFPVVLSAGERRAYTANDIFRDPGWRKRDADGALRVSVEDAQALGLVAGGRARITTAAGSAEASVEISEAMLPGHASLPNGLGLDFVDDDGKHPYSGSGAERAHVNRVARRLRGHAVAQACAGPHRSRKGRCHSLIGPAGEWRQKRHCDVLVISRSRGASAARRARPRCRRSPHAERGRCRRSRLRAERGIRKCCR